MLPEVLPEGDADCHRDCAWAFLLSESFPVGCYNATLLTADYRLACVFVTSLERNDSGTKVLGKINRGGENGLYQPWRSRQLLRRPVQGGACTQVQLLDGG